MARNNAKDAKPFALPDTLRDLALLRASDIDLSALVPSSSHEHPNPDNTGTNKSDANADGGTDEQGAVATASDVNSVVEDSYKFVSTARAAVRLYNRGDAEAQGKRVEDLRVQLEEVKNGLELGAHSHETQ